MKISIILISQKKFYKVLPIIGLAIVIVSFLYFDHSNRHPSLLTVIPIVGILLIICFPNKKDISYKMLSSKIFVGTGLISYSLYLWHFPIFAFARITEITSGEISKKIIMGLIIIVLSIFSYYFIERPFRNKENNFKLILPTLIILISGIVIFSSFVIMNEGYNYRMPENLQAVTNKETHKLLENNKGQQCLQNIAGCEFNTNSNKNVFLIGDSHAAALAFDLKDRIVEKNYKFTTYLIGECGFFPGFNLVHINSKKLIKTVTKNIFIILNRHFFKIQIQS